MDDLNDTALPAADQPCKECKRRKAKCDRLVPECTTCVRARRHCLYERHSRTPLTRKHLTQVEARLERAEALLAKYRGALKQQQAAAPSQQSVQYVTGPGEALTAFGFPTELGSERSPGTAFGDMRFGSEKRSFAASADEKHGIGSAAVSPDPAHDAEALGDPPVALESLDWDEVNKPMVFGDGRSWRQHMADLSPPGSDDDDPHLLDGMAMLSVDGREVGYVGVASGAAFLKYLWRPRTGGSACPSGTSTAHRSPSAPAGSESTSRSADAQCHEYVLPSDVGLRRVIANSFVDAYFSLFHPCLPIVHEESFREVQSGRRRATHAAAWTALANVICSVGAFSAMTECLSVDTPFFYAAKAALSVDMLESGNMTYVQALALMSYYLQKRNKPNSGYTYAGLAVRMAFGLGLHREFRSWKLAPVTRQIRRRVFWGVFVVDAAICMTLSRPFASARFSTDIPLPANIEETELLRLQSEGVDELPPQQSGAWTTYSALRCQADFFLTADLIYKRLIRSPYPGLEELIALDDQHLDTWFHLLPPSFRDAPTDQLSGPYALARLITVCRQLHLRIIMYRPFLVPFLQKAAAGTDNVGSPSPEARAYRLCTRAAHDAVVLTSRFWHSQTRTRMAAWYVLYFTFQAALIPTVCLRNAGAANGYGAMADAAQAWRCDVRDALDAIEDIHFIHASKCASVVHELVDPYMHDATPTEMHWQASHGLQNLVPRQPNLLLEAQDFSMLFPTDGSFDLDADQPLPALWPDAGTPETARIDADLAALHASGGGFAKPPDGFSFGPDEGLMYNPFMQRPV